MTSATSPHANSKVLGEHLRRHAYLYVRQSTLRQVVENAESGKRQYALRDRAVTMGWPLERIVTIDGDQGQSAATATDREGFQHLVAEVGMGKAGIVMGIEVSRLARNNADWHRLLEICALTQTLILDEDGVYDPNHFNDRLVLGLKGTMSEAELHVLRARLRGGILNQARRAELKMRLPTGFVRDPRGKTVPDPDAEVRESCRLLFSTFVRTGSANATVRHWREQGLRFPRRLHTGPDRGALVWGALTEGRAREILRNPCYAGAFVYGRRRQFRRVDGKVRVAARERDDWVALHPGAHEGYIPWDRYEANLAQLHTNAQARGADRRAPPREGPALLQGLALCGTCGRGMTVRYHQRKGELTPEYVCIGIKDGGTGCPSIPGVAIDLAVGNLLLEAVSPIALEVSLAVQQELQERIEEADRLRYRQVERAEQDAAFARQRYMAVHPSNRMVADTLEADWNDKLRAVAAAREHCERQKQSDRAALSEEQKRRILALAHDFPAMWSNKATADRDRKRMARLLIEDVTLVKGDEVAVHVRFRGGATRSLSVPRAKASWETWTTPPGVVARIDTLLDAHTDGQIAVILNAEGFLSGQRKTFCADRVKKTRRAYKLRTRRDRLHDQGFLTLAELSVRLGISAYVIKARRLQGTLSVRSVPLDDTGAHMYEDPAPPTSPPTTCTQEVQYEP
jgi:DNA invertase Pin-like site-specific DNA recombinase